MDNELDASSSHTSLIKWPFYMANALILGTVLSYLLNRADTPIDNWEIATCVFAVALSAMLFFVPYLVEYFISISIPEKADSSRNDGMLEKTYIELKALKEDLSDFGVKLEKIPAIIEKIAGESSGDGVASESFSKLETQFDALRAQLDEVLGKLTDAPSAQPSEPDPRVDDLIATVSALDKTIDQLGQNLGEAPTHEVSQSEPEGEEGDNLAKVDRILEETKSGEYEPEHQTTEFDLEETEDEPDDKEEEEEEEEEGDDAGDDGDEPDDGEEPDDDEGTDDKTGEEETDEEDLDDDEPQDDGDSDDESGPDDEEPEADELIEKDDDDETVEDKSSDGEPLGVVKGVFQPEVVVAKIIIGIGNKVFVRGEGPGLSWDEGVPMAFLEIGKWSWSPADKSAPLVVQLYKNDEEPDGNGKVELEPGEKVEISPEFAD